MDTFAEIRQTVVPLLKPYINRLAVFGSTVRGEVTSESDLDLLIRLKPSGTRPRLGFFKLMEIEETLKEKLGREIDLVTEDSLSPYIRPYVEKEQVVIYEEG
jgi:uncharacterized protein